MNNGDKPVAPQILCPDLGNCPAVEVESLTKREHFAAMAMQGHLANFGDRYSEGTVAKLSVMMADGLLKALENQ